MKTFITGDIHAGLDITKINSRNWAIGKKLNKNDYLICLGDFGFPFRCKWNDETNSVIMSKEDRYWLNWLVEKPWTTFVVLGNHEGIYEVFYNLPLIYKDEIKGYVRELKMEHGSVYYLMRDTSYVFHGKKCLVVGGAKSIDRGYDTGYNKHWWKMELLSQSEINNVNKTIKEDDFTYDYVLSHTCPDFAIPEILGYNCIKFDDPVSKLLTEIESKIEFKEWHFGHLHIDKSFISSDNRKFTCHYNNKPYELS